MVQGFRFHFNHNYYRLSPLWQDSVKLMLELLIYSWYNTSMSRRNPNAEPKTGLPLAAQVTLAGAALYFANKSRQAEHRAKQAEKAEEHIMHQATHDELTGLLNTRGLEKLLAENRPPRAMVYADSTNLKGVNDTLGHDRGNEAIIKTAEVLQNNLRPGDVLARIGGDEFLVLLDPERREDQDILTPDELLGPVISRIGEATHGLLADEENADLVKAGFNIAVGGAVWQQGMAVDDLRGAAEAAMYDAKEIQHAANGSHR